MKRSIYSLVCLGLIATVMTAAHAEDKHWVPENYGTATTPLSWFNDDNWVLSDNTTSAVTPVDGESVAHANPCCAEPYITIDNSGSGVHLPNSNIRFDAKTNIFDSSAGNLSDIAGGSYNLGAVDDALTAYEIAFNGDGGAANDIYVPVIANTFTSNRHGANFFAPITVNTILANSGHQDNWNINASPTDTIDLIELHENRDPEGSIINGHFAFNADTVVNTVEHVWSSLRVGAGATLTVGKVNYWDYRNRASDDNINPIELTGDIEATCFNVFDVETSNDTRLPIGTYGRTGHGSVDNEVEWITAGDGMLTVSSLACPDDPQCNVVKAANGKTIVFCL